MGDISTIFDNIRKIFWGRLYNSNMMNESLDIKFALVKKISAAITIFTHNEIIKLTKINTAYIIPLLYFHVSWNFSTPMDYVI